jgi:hypothetical protein
VRRQNLLSAEPNGAHRALACLEADLEHVRFNPVHTLRL